MDEIIKDLKEHTLFNCEGLRWWIYFLTLIYSLLIIWIILDTILWINWFYNVDKISWNLWSIGLILYILTFVSLIRWGADENANKKLLFEKLKNSIEEIEEEIKSYKFWWKWTLLLLIINKYNGIFTKNELLISFDEVWKNIEKSNYFNNLKAPLWQKSWIDWTWSYKEWKWPLISINEKWKVTITDEWNKAIKEIKKSKS